MFIFGLFCIIMESSQPQMSKTRLFSALQGMSRMRPDMMQKVMESVTNMNEKTAQRPVKTMELFPASNHEELKKENYLNSASSSSSSLSAKECEEGFCEMTIFYDGSVNVLKVSHDKAAQIMKFVKQNSIAEKMKGKPLDDSIAEEKEHEGEKGGLAVVRRASLHRFLQKRKERLSSFAPYPVSQRDSSADMESKAYGIRHRDLDLSLVLPCPRTLVN